MIYYLPLEHLDKRYTRDLDDQLMIEFRRQKKKFTKIDGEPLLGDIKTGAFLDSDSTNYFKFSQLMKVSALFKEGKIKDGDIFFVSDLWFPGLESIPYMAYFHGVKVKIMGLMHAGSWTETDYVAAMQDWAKYIEMGWLRFIDKVFVGSDWIKSELTSKGRITKYGHVIKTGLPFDPQYCFNKAPYIEWDKRPGIVVFAGRLDDEKQPWLFDQLEKEFSKWSKNVRFIKTMEKGYTKKEYYKLLSQSRVMFSSALQENFGYAALECATYGVNLVVPDRLSYREMYPDKYRYKEFSDAVKMVDKFLFEDNTEELMDIALKHKYNVTRIVSQIE